MSHSSDKGSGGPLVKAQDDGLSSILRQIVDEIREGICLQDIHGRIEWVNQACEEMFGWPLRDVRGRFAHDYILPMGKRRPGTDRQEFKYDLTSSIFNQHLIREYQRRDGSRFWAQLSYTLMDLSPGEDQKKIVVSCRDVSDQITTANKLHQVNASLEYAAFHDALTGLGNRKRLNKFLEAPEMAEAIARGTVGVLQIDIDKFKEINDTWGHAAGDAILCHVADALRANSNPDDLICRTGGDEFLMVKLGSDDKDTLQSCAEGLIAAINTPLRWVDETISAGASIGVSTAQSGSEDGEELLIQADNALYSAKHRGRGRVAFYTERMGHQHRAERQLFHDLKIAFDEDQFEVHLQPQLGMRCNSITGCEALIRWNHPERGLLSPAQFLDAAERAGLAAELDYVSMNLSLDALTDLRTAGFHDLRMAINVSSSILSDVNYPGLLDWALQSRDIDPSGICIEILETTIMDGGNLEIATTIERLRHIGVNIALDDFGTGYAGLAHMTAFEVDTIKLDRSMVSRLGDDPRNRMIVRSIIRMCELLKISVVAEGAETQEQLEILRRAKCPFIQGYGIARPMSVTDTLEWLKAHTPLPSPLQFEPRAVAEQIPLSRMQP